jgi:hypothetical protein
MAMKITHFADKVLAFVKYLRTFGGAGVVTIAGKVKVKVDMRGILCMMGGYCTDRVGDCYKMYDPINNNVYLTCDVLWLNHMYSDKDGKVDSLPDVSADAAPAPLALTQVPDTQVVPRRAKKNSKKKSISFSIPNGENSSVVSSVVSCEKQHASFKTKNDIDFEVDDTSEASGDDEVDVEDEDITTSSEEEIIEGTTRSGRSFKNLRSIDKPSRSSEHRGRKDRHRTRNY